MIISIHQNPVPAKLYHVNIHSWYNRIYGIPETHIEPDLPLVIFVIDQSFNLLQVLMQLVFENQDDLRYQEQIVSHVQHEAEASSRKSA